MSFLKHFVALTAIFLKNNLCPLLYPLFFLLLGVPCFIHWFFYNYWTPLALSDFFFYTSGRYLTSLAFSTIVVDCWIVLYAIFFKLLDAPLSRSSIFLNHRAPFALSAFFERPCSFCNFYLFNFFKNSGLLQMYYMYNCAINGRHIIWQRYCTTL